ncbi:MAG: TolC family protein [Acidobacteria bacterium]|nr:MAG: TolC family protein [Acidobacteriota bacterium]
MKRIRQLGSYTMALGLIILLSAPLGFAQAGARQRFVQRDQSEQSATQNSSQTGDQPAQQEDQQEALFGPVHPLMVERVGIDPNQVLRLSLHDAILMALENNNDIQVERTNVQIADYNLKSFRGAYDFFVEPFIQYRSDTRPAPSRLQQGVGGIPLSSTETLDYNISVTQQLPWWGTTWRFSINNTRTLTNNAFAAVNPFYNAAVSIDVTQPLLRNFRIDQTRSQIRIQKKAINLSDSLFRQRVIDIITQVQRAYWDLVFAIRAVEIRQEALELAKTNLENNRKKVEAGTVAPIDLAQSEAQVEQERQNLITAIGNVTAMENALKALIIGDPNAPEWRANIVPTESIGHLAPVLDYESAIRLALANRPELEQLKLRKEQKEIEIKYLKNQTLPQIDLVASYTSNGLKGSEVILDPDLVPPGFAGETPAGLIGGPGDALRQAFTNDFRTVSFGLRMNFPVRNQTARANLGRARAERRSLDFQENKLIQLISTEVRNALQNVETARQNIEAARAARIARERQLEGEQKKFEAGLSTTFFVLQFQNFLSQARLAELQALVNYNKAIADLQRVMSTTLSAHNVEIAPPTGGK